MAVFCSLFVGRKTYAQKEQPALDFITAKVKVQPDFDTKSITGTVQYTFDVKEATATFFIDAQRMTIAQVLLDAAVVPFTYQDNKITITEPLAANTSHTIAISYKASPKKALYFVPDYMGRDQIWTQGQGKYSSNWLPSFDDMNEKVEFDLSVVYKKGYEVIANGALKETKVLNDSLQQWNYDMTHPMSSYLVAMAIGIYDKVEETSKNGIPLVNYIYPEDSLDYKFTYKHNKEIFDFLVDEIGVAFPWQNYKQVPVKDFLYAGMENTTATIFSDAFVVDSIAYKDRNYINVNAHELAHQWFGDLVTETEGTHHWLQEGFATYYALLAERKIFGEDYFLYKLYESAEQLTALSQSPQATSLLDPKANSLTFYQRGAWTLFALQKLIGKANFKITIHNYLQQHQFDNVSTADFFEIATEVSGVELTNFKQQWLENVSFPSQQALAILTEYDFIKKYLALAGERTQPLAGKWGALVKALEFPVNNYLGQEAVYQLAGDTSQEAIAIYDKAFETNNIFVRQAIASSMSTIPIALKEQYETLLQDPSYATIEPALYHLWANFAADRAKYLEETSSITGFSDNNVRILWLVLALSTPEYNQAKHSQYFKELTAYTSPDHHFSTRQNAFSYLESMNAFNDQALLHLVNGATHYNWRFRDACRKILDDLLKKETFKKKYVDLKEKLSQSELEYLRRKMEL
ncbi:M1 family metallopeptidase [Aquimarina brevivitae]|nr:M1 family metallopeptidase [Aquimarina brevivitae]